MRVDWFAKTVLLAIAILLGVIAWRLEPTPPVVEAQFSEGRAVFVEPGVSMLRAPDGSRQVLGKVIVDLRNGNIWGFPTLTQDPYPSAGTNTTPPTSHPFLLGKFALSDMDK